MTIVVGSIFLVALMLAGVFLLFLKKVPPDKAMIIVTPRGSHVVRNHAVVYPLIHHAELIDLTTKAIPVTRAGADALVTRDDQRVDVTATFHLRVPDNAESILDVAKKVGCERAGDVSRLRELFEARFARALADAVRALNRRDLDGAKRERAEETALAALGDTLDGMQCERITVDRVEPTERRHDP